MGADTRAELKGYVSDDEVFAFIKTRFDWRAISNIESHQRVYDDDNGVKCLESTIDGRIKFEVEEDDFGCIRELFYSFNISADGNWKESCKKNCETDMDGTNNVTLTLGYWGSSVDIMNTIVSHFGGWVDDNDSDDVGYRPVPKVGYPQMRDNGDI